MKRLLSSSARLSITVLFILLFTLQIFTVNVFAWDVQSIVRQEEIGGDPTTHVYALTANKTAKANQIRLNQYCTSYPSSGTRVTTWKNTNHQTQWWGFRTVAGGEDVLACYRNANVALNITRVGSTPEANVYNIAGNRYGDVIISRTGNNISGFKWYMHPRYIHPSKMYLRQSTSSVPNSGGGKYVHWSTTGSNFYLYDVSWEFY